MSENPEKRERIPTYIKSSFKIVIAVADDNLADTFINALNPFGYYTVRVDSGKKALQTIESMKPDLIISSVELPEMSGLLLLRTIKKDPALADIPFVLITQPKNMDEKLRGFQLGADDFFSTPIHELELRAKVRSMLKLRTAHQRLSNEKRLLEIKIKEATKELQSLTFGLVAALEKVTELTDTDTGRHIMRVSAYSALIGETIGLEETFIYKLRLYAPMHDIGKVGVPDAILKKTGSLTTEEFEEMKKHTVYGYELLQSANADEIAQNIALSHHERFDGSGYPFHLKGGQIPLEARIVALADVFDAMTTRRCYKEPIAFDLALEEISRKSMHLFDPELVKAMVKRESELWKIMNQLSDSAP